LESELQLEGIRRGEEGTKGLRDGERSEVGGLRSAGSRGRQKLVGRKEGRESLCSQSIVMH